MHVVKMEVFQKETCVRRYHVYESIWVAAIGEELQCQRELSNAVDCYTVAIIQDGAVVGHVPRKISRLCSLLRHDR